MKPINLNRREKYYVTAAGVFIFLLIVFQLIVSPLLNKRERLERLLVQKTEELKEMRALQSEYLVLEKSAELAKSEISGRDKNFSLFSFLDHLAVEVGISVSSMKPSTGVVADVKISTVELKIDAITMEQLAKYLYQIEYSGNNLFVKRMSISKTGKPEGYIDVSLQVETIES